MKLGSVRLSCKSLSNILLGLRIQKRVKVPRPKYRHKALNQATKFQLLGTAHDILFLDLFWALHWSAVLKMVWQSFFWCRITDSSSFYAPPILSFAGFSFFLSSRSAKTIYGGQYSATRKIRQKERKRERVASLNALLNFPWLYYVRETEL